MRGVGTKVASAGGGAKGKGWRSKRCCLGHCLLDRGFGRLATLVEVWKGWSGVWGVRGDEEGQEERGKKGRMVAGRSDA